MAVLVLLACSAPVPSSALTLDEREKADLKLLLALHGEAAKQAHDNCKQTHGDACKVPCKAIPGCAGCVSDVSGNTCVFCLAGHHLSADKKSCKPCPEGTVSKGGLASSCDTCEAGTTPVQGSYACEPSAARAPETPRQPGNIWHTAFTCADTLLGSR